MSGNKQNTLAVYYYLDDLPGAHIPASRLVTILERLQQGLPLSSYAITYLEHQGLLALHRHASSSSSIDEFRKDAEAEQIKRKQTAEELKRAKEAEQRERETTRKAQIKLAQEKAKAARLALERDPKYIAKVKNQKLRARYDLDQFIEKHCFANLMDILRRIDAGRRLSEKDVLWLSTEGDDYYSDRLRSAYHSIEAEFYAGEFKKNKDPWMAINASSHYRKGSKAGIADKLLSTINIDKKKSPKIKSAFFTTHGGVKRDLGQKDEALSLGEKAHLLMCEDFRPCTLIGAVYMETGRYILGQEWYAKAVERGASERAIDSDLRSIFMRADKASKDEMRAHLLGVDPIRYHWMKNY
ncbi:hypothetical protein [Amphritea sp.]|uniref:hypothetical protein n=1 Tax=Amphritea sp. TaxID=1872502 RepID=UPI0035672C5D